MPPEPSPISLLYDENGREQMHLEPGAPPPIELPEHGGPILIRPAVENKLPHFTDMGNGEWLVQQFGQDLRFVGLWGKWFVWDGQRWAVDDIGRIEQLAKEAVRAMIHRAADLTDEKLRHLLIAHATRTESQRAQTAMILMARSEPGIPVKPEDFDRDFWLLNCENGTVDLKTGTLRPHSREDLITKLAPVRFDPDAKCPRWLRFLEEVLPDPSVRTYFQRVIGYSLTGSVDEQELYFLFGAGANGKSTAITTILGVLGDYAKSAAPDLLIVTGNDKHPTGLADLLGARFIATSEVEDGKRLAEALVKQLSGADKVKARFMRQDFFEFTPTHKLFVAANHRPVIRGTDHAMWRRIRLIPFTVTIPQNKQDKTLVGKLHEERSGILNWALEGCLAWQREGLVPPDAVTAAVEDYRKEQDVLGSFLADCCSIGEAETAPAGKLYEVYRGWLEETGEPPESQKRFGGRLKEKGFVQGQEKDRYKTRYWRGLSIKAALL